MHESNSRFILVKGYRVYSDSGCWHTCNGCESLEDILINISSISYINPIKYSGEIYTCFHLSNNTCIATKTKTTLQEDFKLKIINI